MCVWVCVYMHTHMHNIYIYIYKMKDTHTHTHTYIHTGLEISGFTLSNTNQFRAKCKLLSHIICNVCKSVTVVL